jgi:serralysin
MQEDKARIDFFSQEQDNFFTVINGLDSYSNLAFNAYKNSNTESGKVKQQDTLPSLETSSLNPLQPNISGSERQIPAVRIGKDQPVFSLNSPSTSLQNLGFAGSQSSSFSHDTNFSGIMCACPNCGGVNGGNAQQTTTLNGTTTTTQIAANTPSISGDYQIDGLLSGFNWGFSWGSRQLTYSFYEDSVFAGAYYGSETGVREVSEGVKTNVRSILGWLGNAINISFQEVAETDTSTYGRMRFMLSNNPSYAFAYYPSSDSLASRAGDIHLNPSYDRLGDTNGFQNQAGSHGFMTLIHEIGHALGLKHPHEATSRNSSILPSGDNNFTNTLMTYNFSDSTPATLMRYDLKTLQHLYGANTSFNSGDTFYQFTGRIDRYSVNGQLSANTTLSIKQLLWDGGGRDTLDFSGLAANSSGYRFDLNPGGLLTARSGYNATNDSFILGTQIAYNVLVENIINSSSNDEIFLNNATNTVGGYTSGRFVGSDVIWNANAQDILDLTSYSSAAVTNTRINNDLVLGLGTNGSVTVKNYYIGSDIQIRYGDSIIPTTAISINDISIVEGNSGQQNAVFTLNLDRASTEIVTVNFVKTNGTATAGSDYLSSTGTITFNAGETSKILSVPVFGDTLPEANETFFLNLSNATNAVIERAQGVGTIQNDDVIPPAISINNLSVNEGRRNYTNFNFSVRLDRTSSQAVTVNFATANGTAIAGSDYLSTGGTLTFNPGEISKTITVRVVGDITPEPNETFFVNLSNASNATISRTQAIGTILNDDGTASQPRNLVRDTSANNVIVGVNLDRQQPGTGEKDILLGTSAANTFVLGDALTAYYDDGNSKLSGLKDFALIRGFDSLQGDVIQLHGSSDLYRLGASPRNFPTGTAIYLKDNVDELIAVVQGVQSLDLNIGGAFRFVS